MDICRGRVCVTLCALVHNNRRETKCSLAAYQLTRFKLISHWHRSCGGLLMHSSIPNGDISQSKCRHCSYFAFQAYHLTSQVAHSHRECISTIVERVPCLYNIRFSRLLLFWTTIKLVLIIYRRLVPNSSVNGSSCPIERPMISCHAMIWRRSLGLIDVDSALDGV